MDLNIGKEVAHLQRMTMKELRGRFAEAFGENTNANNKAWLVKRIAWRLQSLAEGDLSERARRRAAELANDADLRVLPPREKKVTPVAAEPPSPAHLSDDSRLPMPGAIIAKKYKGRLLTVKVLANGFEFEGTIFRSLSALAKTITGSHSNGFHFFGLNKDTA